MEEPSYVEMYGPGGELLKNVSAPDGPEQDGNPAVVELMTEGVKEMIVYMGGSGAVRRVRECKPKEPFCPGPPGELTFNSFSHGDEIEPDSIKGVTITAERRATAPQPGHPKNCSGPLLILDTRHPDFRSFDKDLKNCTNCTLMLWSKDGNRKKVNDCGEHPGVAISFKFKKLQSLVDIELWDMEEPSYVEMYGPDDELLKNVSAPDGPEQDGNPAVVELMTKGVKEMIVYMGGSGAVRRIRACKAPGSVVGDPHIYTLDGDKFDFYQNGTFSVFHYYGQKLLHPTEKNATVDWQLYSHYGGPFWTAQGVLLVDRSMGSMRQALELTSKDCQWYKRVGHTWFPVKRRSLLTFTDHASHKALTMFEHVHEKKVVLKMKTENGWKDTLVLNTVCKPSGINMRISMPDMGESRFLEGQIQVGNGEEQKKFVRKQNWTALGGSGPAANFISQLESKPIFSQLSACGQAERAKAEQTCIKHLGTEMRTATGDDASIFRDCVSDVCRGGEEFAVAAKELLAAFTD
ncbi:amt-3 [Symbiodinium natans]|uniref:Amt-3 protein n=1 Tax=Symbiodinium natans TaxID=878477 RepID=A0A812QNS4_9DINO|nr:amt-3 [Symbiodinium natans]